MQVRKKAPPQGGVISPLLNTIYPHKVLDNWFVEFPARIIPSSMR